jgi:hypothetical protein
MLKMTQKIPFWKSSKTNEMENNCPPLSREKKNTRFHERIIILHFRVPRGIKFDTQTFFFFFFEIEKTLCSVEGFKTSNIFF